MVSGRAQFHRVRLGPFQAIRSDEGASFGNRNGQVPTQAQRRGADIVHRSIGKLHEAKAMRLRPKRAQLPRMLRLAQRESMTGPDVRASSTSTAS